MEAVGRIAKRLKLDVSAINDRVEAMLYYVYGVNDTYSSYARGGTARNVRFLITRDVSTCITPCLAEISEFNVHFIPSLLVIINHI